MPTVALTLGTRLGVYEVTAQIGVGGMAKSIKPPAPAWTAPLPLKVLPEHVATDPELKRRFEREVKTLQPEPLAYLHQP